MKEFFWLVAVALILLVALRELRGLVLEIRRQAEEEKRDSGGS